MRRIVEAWEAVQYVSLAAALAVVVIASEVWRRRTRCARTAATTTG